MNVANTPSVAASQSRDWSVGLDPETVVGSMPGVPFQKHLAAEGSGHARLFADITGIPEGEQLLITHISGTATCVPDEGQPFHGLRRRGSGIGLWRSIAPIPGNQVLFAEPLRQVSPGGVFPDIVQTSSTMSPTRSWSRPRSAFRRPL